MTIEFSFKQKPRYARSRLTLPETLNRDFPDNTHCLVYSVGYCVFLFLMLFVTVCLCGQLFVDIWLSVWLNAAAEQVRH